MRVEQRNGGARLGPIRRMRGHAPDTVSLRLPAKPESVGVARREVAALGARLGLDKRRIDDLKTLVSEACANAVRHAYGGGPGEIRVRAVPKGNALMITVLDNGDGIRPRPASEGTTGRLGLLLMAALATKVEIAQRPGGGTRLRARFPLSPDGD